jgi:radical SAM superfamily enzyme YgiQ (UPF0313 family)
LGISYVAAACAAAGAEVAIFDYIVSQYSPEKLRDDIDSFNPDIVGATAVTMNFITAARIVQEAKQYKPSLVTMMGGPHVTFDIEGTLNSYPEIDIILMGEGEETLMELLPLITDKRTWAGIKGIAFRSKGETIITEPRPPIEDLDSLPLPARHLLPMSRYQALGYPVSIITSRGCPNRCIFCLGRKMVGYKVRYRSPAKVVDEIEHILSYGVDRINIADDIFTANKQRVKELCNEITRRGITFGWSAFSRVNTVDKETLQIMSDAGCDSISFGIESGNSEMLKRVRKGITLDQARNAIRYCKEVGIGAHASFMVGLPGETHQTMEDSRIFGDELDIVHGYHLLAPFPGTTVRENIDEYDLEILTNDWDRYDANRAIVRTSALNPEEMNNFVESFNARQQEKWEAVVTLVSEGKGTPYESLRVEGVQRTLLIFKLLSEDVISEAGTFPRDGLEPATDLARRITTITKMDGDFVNRTIKSLADAGYLKFDAWNGHISWFWTHNNRIDKSPITSQ